jgi:TRAP-type C4-dicarboxylate transport system substrate-binding protein
MRREEMAKKKVLTAVLLMMAILLSSSPGFSQATIQWRGQNAYNPPPEIGPFPKRMAGTGNSAVLFGDWLNRETKGRFQLNLSPAGSVVPVNQMFQAVSKGTIDFGGLYYGAFHSGVMPETDIEVGLPFAWETVAEAWDGLHNRNLIAEFRKIYAEHNIYWIPVICNSHYSFGTTFSVPNLEALKGKKIRAGGVYGKLVAAIGASPVNMPAGEVYMGLKLGTIDGTILDMGQLEANKLKEVWTNYVVNPNLSVIIGSFLINMNSFNKLPDDIKSMIENQADTVLLQNSLNNYVFEEYLATQASKNFPFKRIQWSDSDITKIREIGYGLWEPIANQSPRCAKLVEIVRNQMRDLGKMK